MPIRAAILSLTLSTFTMLTTQQIDEIAVARSAAPKEVSADADIYVYRERDGTFARAVTGTNGVACLVTRDGNPEGRYPQCLNPSAVKWVLPLIFEEHRMRHAGKSESEIDGYLDKAYRAAYTREHGATSPAPISYMMSPYQVLFAGKYRVGQWHPHVMIYSPGASFKDFALTAESRIFGMNSPGQGPAHLFFVVPTWADSVSAARPTSPPQP